MTSPEHVIQIHHELFELCCLTNKRLKKHKGDSLANDWLILTTLHLEHLGSVRPVQPSQRRHFGVNAGLFVCQALGRCCRTPPWWIRGCSRLPSFLVPVVSLCQKIPLTQKIPCHQVNTASVHLICSHILWLASLSSPA